MITTLKINAETFRLAFGIITFLLGIGLRYWINRRRFYRRNLTGIETFSSYEKLVIIKLLERFGKLIAWALILFGLLISVVFYRVRNIETDKKEPIRIEKRK